MLAWRFPESDAALLGKLSPPPPPPTPFVEMKLVRFGVIDAALSGIAEPFAMRVPVRRLPDICDRVTGAAVRPIPFSVPGCAVLHLSARLVRRRWLSEHVMSPGMSTTLSRLSRDTRTP